MGSGADNKKKNNIRTFNQSKESEEFRRLTVQKEEQVKEGQRLTGYKNSLDALRDSLAKERDDFAIDRKNSEIEVSPLTLKDSISDLTKQCKCLIDHDSFKHNGDEHHILSIAKRTLESVIARLKIIEGYL